MLKFGLIIILLNVYSEYFIRIARYDTQNKWDCQKSIERNQWPSLIYRYNINHILRSNRSQIAAYVKMG